MGEDEYDAPTILGRPFLKTIKVIIYIGTGEVHMHFPSKKIRMRRRRRNRNQKRQIIKDGWADYEGEVVRSEDIQLEQNRPEETVALSQMWKEKIVIAAGTTDYAIQRIPGRLRKRREMRSCLNTCVLLRHEITAETFESILAQGRARGKLGGVC